MQFMSTNWQARPQTGAAFAVGKESRLKLSLETRYQADVIIVHCQGRIVYRDEAAALSRVVGDVMSQARKIVLDLSGVSSLDSAGIGKLRFCTPGRRKKMWTSKSPGPTIWYALCS